MLLQGQSNKGFLIEVLRKYYGQRPLVEPPLLPKREIAVQPIGSNTYIRHLSFPSMIKLYEYILENPPLHLYYSVAVYEDPSVEDMESKGLLKADLMFDIDVDHFEACRDTVNVCLKCGYVYSGGRECPKCSSKEVSSIPQLSNECFRLGWAGVLTLVDILEKEFGAREITVSFSGSRGFHVRVEDEHLTVLDRDSRRAIVEYLNLSNLVLEKIVPRIGRGRDAKALFFKDREYGFRSRLRELAEQLLSVEDYGDYILVKYSDLEGLLDTMRIEIDTVVTIDTSRLSRFIHSINGKSGLAVCRLDPDKDYSFSFRDYRVVDGEVVVKPRYDIPEAWFLDKKMSLRAGEKKRVEAYIGLYLVLKGLVDIIDYSGVEVRKPCL